MIFFLSTVAFVSLLINVLFSAKLRQGVEVLRKLEVENEELHERLSALHPWGVARELLELRQYKKLVAPQIEALYLDSIGFHKTT